eukprot:1670389-Amphidinium_carterae.1
MVDKIQRTSSQHNGKPLTKYFVPPSFWCAKRLKWVCLTNNTSSTSAVHACLQLYSKYEGQKHALNHKPKLIAHVAQQETRLYKRKSSF